MVQRLSKHLGKLVATALLGGLLGATLVRFAPGFDVDVRELDPRLSERSIEELRQQRRADDNVARFYGRYLLNLAHGDFGFSRNLNQPANKLFAERFPVTLRETGFGLLVGWMLGVGLAIAVVVLRAWPVDLLAGGISATLLSIPAAVLALIFVFLRGPAGLAVALILLPKIFGYSRNLLRHSYSLPHVLTARSKGLSEARVFLWHVLPTSGPQLLALLGISVTLAFGAAIPVEALCDLPGIGQLAWQSALARDLILLVNLTVLVTLITVAANTVSDLLGHSLAQGEI
jgi:ABC-type dipeptide/oligopeptide/nickel transport system permease component